MEPVTKTVTNVIPTIYYLSDIILSTEQIDLLQKGLKFTPNPKININDVKTDLNDFCRKLRLTEFYFKESEEMNSDENKKINIVMKKGHFHPPIGRDAVLDNYINCLQKYPLEDNIRNYRGNLNANEKQALDKLKAEESIIIKEADKGGGIVIMNKDFYCKNILLMLEDASTYKETSVNPDMKIMKELRKLVDRGDTV